ncbi:MAG: cysteine desulfurase [Clostridia bacterium]|nr:cysteine desulfurase [Clostridia bacterium]
MENIYFDNSATTPPATEAVQTAVRFMTEEYGNPSSLHHMGISAAAALNNARKIIADELGCDVSEVYFTSGGTESNNTAIIGGAIKNKHIGNGIVTSAFEHDSVINTVKSLEAEGFKAQFVSPDKNGCISAEKFAEKVDKNTALVSCMLVNNEIGTINDVAQIFKLAKAKNPSVICHCDAVQAFGKISCLVKKLCCDMMSISGHKIHAIKGVGALYIKKGLVIRPRNIGGGQENSMRSGTESVPLIAAFSEATKLCKQKAEHHIKVQSLNERIKNALINEGFSINSPSDAIPYILNVSVLGVRSEVVLNYLSSKGICVSAGSACSKGKRSHVLSSMGLDAKRIDSAIRISLSRYNTEDEADKLINALIEAKQLLTIKR